MPADLLLLHGFTQTGASWDGVVRALAGRYRALAPDLGAGPWEAELDRLAALAPAGYALAGYSLGGRRARPRGPPAAHGGRARGAAARARDRRHAATVGPAGGARDAGDPRGRGA